MHPANISRFASELGSGWEIGIGSSTPTALEAWRSVPQHHERKNPATYERLM
jgi:hypothetical protein